MELIQVKIKGTVVTQRYGTLTSGDLLRTDVEFAKHLVEDCGAAEYMQPVANGEADQKSTRAKKK